jgi:hypothetical protein
VLLAVVLLLGAQVSELFDTWDNTLETGNDIEFSVTVIALCIGACVLFAKLLLRSFHSLIVGLHPFLFQQRMDFPGSMREAPFILLSPSPPPLRV